MSIPTRPITLTPETERSGQFGFFHTSTDITGQFDGRFPAAGQWRRILDLPIWDDGHWATLTESGGVINDSLAAEVLANELGRTDGGDADTLIDCLAEAIPFRYELREVERTLDDPDGTGTRMSIENRLMRVHELAFSYALAQRMQVSPVEIASGRRFTAENAIAVADDALLNRGIYDGVIHVPAFLAAKIGGDLETDNRTRNGTQVHLIPSTVMATPGAVYATSAVSYAQGSDRVAVVPGLGDPAEERDPGVDDRLVPHLSHNKWFGSGVFHGAVAFDGSALVVQSDTLTTLSTAAA